jgi:hypothetical protein
MNLTVGSVVQVCLTMYSLVAVRSFQMRHFGYIRFIPVALLAACTSAPAKQSALMDKYVSAINAEVSRNWLRTDGVASGSKCAVKVTQLPGGRIVAASILDDCALDSIGKRSIWGAVVRTVTLPYDGYESVFRRELVFYFVAP